jgi:hypothetical protein
MSNGCRTGLIVPPDGEGSPQGVYCADARSAADEAVRIFEQVTPVARITPGAEVISARVLGSSPRIIRLAKVALPLDST